MRARVEGAEVVMLEKWPDEKGLKKDWRSYFGRRFSIGQNYSGVYYIKIQNVKRERYSGVPDQVFEHYTSSSLLKVKPDEVDAILDSLITLKELMKANRPVSSIKRKDL